MQLASIHAPIPTPVPVDGNPGPIGVSSFGTLRIGHALNGIAYSDHKILSPLTKPFGSFGGSLESAIAGAQALLLRSDSSSTHPGAVALVMDGRGWAARSIIVDDAVMQVINHGVGTGGIASAAFTDVSRSLAALVTAQGSVLASELR